MTISCDTLKARLTEAETALHALSTGEQVVSISYGFGEKTVAYSQAKIADLRAYISDLKDEIARNCNPKSSFRRRAFGIIPVD